MKIENCKLQIGRRAPSCGWTLIELVLVMTLLVLVMTTSYKLVVDCLEAERRIDKMTTPEKVGEGILALFRRDIAGTYFRNMGRRVFSVADAGVPPQARDEIRFLTTVEPTPVQDQSDRSTVASTQLRTITGVGYFLRQSQLPENVEAYTLFRKEITQFDPLDPLAGAGTNYEIYNKMKYLSIECFDGWSWYPEWSSEARIQAEEDDLAVDEGQQKKIARVSDPQATSPQAVASAPGVDPNASEAGLLPPAAVPIAVRLEVGIYVSAGGKIEREAVGNEPVVKRYSTIIPILTSQRVPIEEDEGTGETGLTDASGQDSGERGDGPRRLGGLGGQGLPPGLGPEMGGEGGRFGGQRSRMGATGGGSRLGGAGGSLRGGQRGGGGLRGGGFGGGGRGTGGGAPQGTGPRH